MNNFQDKVGFVWSIAELLRGDFKQSEYGKVVLPFIVLRRLDCLLDETKEKVLQRSNNLQQGLDGQMRDAMLNKAAGGYGFHNISSFTFEKLKADPDNILANLHNYIAGFSESARDIFIDKFEIDKVMTADKKLEEQALANDIDQFRYGFEKKITETLIDRMERNEKISTMFLDNPEMRSYISDEIMKEVYWRFRQPSTAVSVSE
jgi:type I restriction-modification system DNA methylase subunit